MLNQHSQFLRNLGKLMQKTHLNNYQKYLYLKGYIFKVYIVMLVYVYVVKKSFIIRWRPIHLLLSHGSMMESSWQQMQIILLMVVMHPLMTTQPPVSALRALEDTPQASSSCNYCHQSLWTHSSVIIKLTKEEPNGLKITCSSCV